MKMDSDKMNLKPTTSIPHKCDIVFIGIHNFYHQWKDIKSVTLMSALIILPNICIEWIMDPSSFTNASDSIDSNANFYAIFTDQLFMNTLKL